MMRLANGDPFKKASLNLKDLSQGLRGGKSNAALRRAADDIGNKGVEIIQDSIRRNLKRDTGRLSASWKATRSRVEKGTISVSITSDSIYARLQDKGGVQRPVRANFLTIPVHPTAKRGQAWSHANTGVRRGRNGKLYIIKKGAGRDYPIYRLEKSIRIPGSKYLQKAQRRLRRYVKRRMNAGIRDLSLGVFRR